MLTFLCVSLELRFHHFPSNRIWKDIVPCHWNKLSVFGGNTSSGTKKRVSERVGNKWRKTRNKKLAISTHILYIVYIILHCLYYLHCLYLSRYSWSTIAVISNRGWTSANIISLQRKKLILCKCKPIRNIQLY